MMEESSDESTEIITHEEAEMAQRLDEAEQMATSTTTSSSGTASSPVSGMAAVSPPLPLPAFVGGGGAVSPPSQTSISSPVANPVVSPSTVGSGSIPTTPVLETSSVTPPEPVPTPYEVSSSIVVQPQISPPSPESPAPQGPGLFGWISQNRLVSKVMEKTKSGVESMITTLDPGMKEVIKSGGDINIVVTSTKDNKLGAAREAFQLVFGKATITGQDSQATTAAQPVGFTAGLKGAEERIQNLRHSGTIADDQAIMSIEGFIVEMLPDRWYEVSCLILQDPAHRIELQTFSQPNPIPTEYILQAQDRTKSDYPLRWAGLAVTIGQVIEESQPHIGHAEWQNALVGVSRRESLFMAAKVLAYMYKQRLPTSFIS